jgi:hypothetical protein
MEAVHDVYEAREREGGKRADAGRFQERADRTNDLSSKLLHHVQALSSVSQVFDRLESIRRPRRSWIESFTNACSRCSTYSTSTSRSKASSTAKKCASWPLPARLNPRIVELQQVDELVTPQDKLQCFVNAYQIIVDAILVYAKPGFSPGADDINPPLIYATLKAQPKRVYTTLKYEVYMMR